VTVMTVAGLSINPLAITVDTGDAITFSAVGGTAPYSYSIISGVGGTITSAGVYTAPGTTGSDTIQVTDSIGGTNTTIVQIGHPGLPVISPSAITLITNATQTFTASGGFAPYTYSVATGTGTINATTGLYTAPATAESSTVKVTDFLGYTATATLTVNAPLPLTISPTSASVALSGAASFTASGGVPPYTYTATSGTINATTGAYTAPATAPAPPAVTITVTDSNMPASTATATVNLTSGCGQTFAETEPNDAYNPNPFTDANQHGIILAPGCTATVTGTTDAGITNDTFQFHRGVSAGVTVTATWAGVNDIDLEIFSGAGIWWTSGLSTASGFDSLTYTFTATDIADVPVDTYFITVRNLTSSGVAYTVTVTGN
ncbi:MAG: hypothetical protein OEZ36_00130, partial [Spirochaetota bacterium]|nr:hypothetical protein [Spirochaetota bacterium]